MRRFLAFASVFLLAAFSLASPPKADAQQGIQVTRTEAENRAPEEIVFQISARSDSSIQRLFLRYKILPDGPLTTAMPEFTPGQQVSVTFRLRGNDPPRIYIHPGATIEYFWEIQDASGRTFSTPVATIAYQDIRFQWQSASEGNLTVYWYGGNEAVGRALLRIGRETLDRMSALLGTKVAFPVKVWTYASPRDMQAAIQQRSQTFEGQVITAGQRVSSDTVLILAGGAADNLRHELAHIVTKQAGEGPFGRLPSWLDEGTAMYAQSSPGAEFEAALQSALRRGNVFPLRVISSPPGNPEAVNLFYSQSWSVVKFLVETLGPEKFARLFAVFKEGSTVDNALRTVYGFDLAGLDDQWRASAGLQPAPAVSPAAAPATAPPRSQPQPAQPTAPAEDEGLPVVTIAVLAGLSFAALLLALAAGRLLWRRLP